MAARRTRKEVQARILAAFNAQLDRENPEEESIPLRGATFADVEEQVETLVQAAVAASVGACYPQTPGFNAPTDSTVRRPSGTEAVMRYHLSR